MKSVVSRNVMQRSEKYAIGYLVSSKELMNRAGMAVMRSYNFKGEVLVVTGAGNNAGDGYALALHLKERNISVTIALVSNKFSLNGKVYFEKEDVADTPSKVLLRLPERTSRGRVLHLYGHSPLRISQKGETASCGTFRQQQWMGNTRSTTCSRKTRRRTTI